MICHVWILMLVALMAGLSGCAGFDASVLDTAETLGKDQLEIGYIYSPGIDASKWNKQESDDLGDVLSITLMQSLEVKYGIEEDLDGSLRLSASTGGFSSKALLKKQISKQDGISTAVAFGGGLIIGNENYWDNDSSISGDIDHRLYSAEAQLLVTRVMIRDIYVTLAGKANMHWYRTKEPGFETFEETYNHGGLRLVMSRTHKGLTMMIEGGVEAPFTIENIEKAYPWGGMKLSLKLNRKNKK